MFFQITGLYFPARHFQGRPEHWVAPGAARAWDGVATSGEIGPPATGPLPLGQQLRRWGALLALGGLALPGISAVAAVADDRPPALAAAGQETATGQTTAPGLLTLGGLPTGDAGDGTPATAAPWEAGVVEADGRPLPSAPPPGPVPVDGVPQPAVAAPPTTTPPPVPVAPTAKPAPGETVRSVPNQSVAAATGRADDLVPADREYLRPILIRFAQENGLPADLVMSLAWVESSWRRNVVSDAGAVGVMQLMPNTVEYVSQKLLGLKSNLDPKNPTSNVRMGAKYLRRLLDQSHGNIRQALIAYNQGLTSLKANGSYGVADRYADRVLALRPQFRSA
jgi:soluble lytic murein transglycosylase-like protein